MKNNSQPIDIPITDVNRELRDRISVLESVCAEAYMLAGACGAPEKALDNLSDAASGRPIRHKTFLPIYPDEDLSEVKCLNNKIKLYEEFIWEVSGRMWKNEGYSIPEQKALSFYIRNQLLKHFLK